MKERDLAPKSPGHVWGHLTSVSVQRNPKSVLINILDVEKRSTSQGKSIITDSFRYTESCRLKGSRNGKMWLFKQNWSLVIKW